MNSKPLFSILAALALTAAVTACGAEDGPGHSHDGGAHEQNEDDAHDHDDSEPETRAIYEDEAPGQAPGMKDSPEDDQDHEHGKDGGHSH